MNAGTVDTPVPADRPDGSLLDNMTVQAKFSTEHNSITTSLCTPNDIPFHGRRYFL